MESMCCGTPVVGFNIGGIPDLIAHGKNGYIAKYKDPEDMVKGIKYCLENKIKGFLLPIFEPFTTVKKHLDLFEHFNSVK
jgi:glycosyltransferase involved in cell wall biosynthesis